MWAPERRVSFADLQRAPEDGRRYELYDGEVRVVPSPLPSHQVIVDNVHGILKRYSRMQGGLSFISPLDVVFSEYDVLQPDVVFFQARRRRLIDLNAPIRVPPDLVVEVLSPGSVATDRGRKMDTFARHGVPEYWIADPASGCVEVHVLDAEAGEYRLGELGCGDDEVRSAHLQALAFSASDAFRMP